VGTRRKGRECALQLLYQADFSPMDAAAANDLYWQIHIKEETVRTYAEFLYFGTLEHKADIDTIIQKFSEHWRLERMAVVDRNILRLAAYEMLYTDTPGRVAINEAVELAKVFGAEQSPAFVNAILDRVMRERP